MEGVPWGQTKWEPGEVHTQKGVRAWPQADRKREVVVGPEPVMDNEGMGPYREIYQEIKRNGKADERSSQVR